MEQYKLKTKSLTINKTVYASYQMKNDLLFVKIRKQIIPDDAVESENILIEIISLIERKRFSHVGYLNIK